MSCPSGSTTNFTGAEDFTSCQCTAEYIQEPTGECTECPKGLTADANRKACEPCAAGTFKRVIGNTPCTACPDGHFCKVGATEPAPCNGGERCINGTIRQKRPCAPKPLSLEKIGGPDVAAVKFQWEFPNSADDVKCDSHSEDIAFIKVQTSVSRVAGEFQDIETFEVRLEPPFNREVNISGLNFQATYYVRGISHKNVTLNLSIPSTIIVESIPGDFSDPVFIKCPPGAWCGGKPGGNRLPIGVPAKDVVAADGFARIGWAVPETVPSSSPLVPSSLPPPLTFYPCVRPSVCRGPSETDPNATAMCVNGTDGVLCNNCLPTFARSGAGRCSKCLEARWQNLIFAAALLCGIIILAIMLSSTLQERGKVSFGQSGR